MGKKKYVVHFAIDTGSLPRNKAEEYLKIMQKQAKKIKGIISIVTSNKVAISVLPIKLGE